MPTLDDIYGGILKPGPQGGIYEPGPEVVFPTQGNGSVVRVTPEGLNVYQRQVVAIDKQGNPIIATVPTGPVMRSANNSGAQKTTGGMAGTVALPPDVRPEAVDLAFAEIDRQKAAQAPPKANDLGYYPAQPLPVPPSNDPRLPKGDPNWYSPEAVQRGLDIASALYPRPAINPAIDAIDAATLPRVRPLPPARIPLTAAAAPKASAPVMRAAPAPQPVMRARPITYDQPRVMVPGSAGEVNGVDMAFMPISVQTSSRWRTGY